MHYFEFETDQIVVAMETKPCDQSPGINASFTSLRVEADLQQNNKGIFLICCLVIWSSVAHLVER